MKRSLIFAIFALFSLSYSLQYLESSNGLIPPTLEGGRTEIEMVDINNDGNLDLISIGDHGSPNINSDQHGIMVWFGDGRGNWGVYMNGDFGYGGVAVGDVNNDGFLDVGYGMHHNYSGNDFGDQVMEVALGDGTGRNWIPWDDSLGLHGQDWGMFGTDLADIDNDGYLDIGSNSFGADDGIHIYLNLGNGVWRRSFGFSGGNSNMDFVFGDINRDGFVDFASAHQYGSVYFGDGRGNFTRADRNLPPPGSYNAYRSVDLGDVDNDGGMDLGFITPQGAVSVWVFNESGDTWVNFSGSLPTSSNFNRIQLFDMDVDGFLDVVAQGRCTLKIWLGNGLGAWQETVRIITPSPGYGQALRVGGDCDRNGYPDIAVILEEGSWPNYRNRFRFFKENSLSTQLDIKPIFPKGGERFYAGSVSFIKWISAVPNSLETPSWMRVEFSSQGPNGPWSVLYDSLPNNGLKQWNIPNHPSDNCYLRLWVFTTSESISVVTPRPFVILGSVSISRILAKNLYPQESFCSTLIFRRGSRKIPISLFPSGFHSLQIYSFTGRVIDFEKEIEREGLMVELEKLARGIYFLNLEGRIIKLLIL